MAVATAKTQWADLPSSLQDIERAQRTDILCQELSETISQSKPECRHYVQQQGVLSKYGGFNFQLVVPAALLPEFLAYIHNSPLGGHLGKTKTILKIMEGAWWPTICRDIWNHVCACPICQQYRGSNSKPAGFFQTMQVKEPGEIIGVDFLSLFPLYKSQNSVLMELVDYFSKRVELFVLKDAKMPRVTSILKNDIFTRWGVPACLKPDKGHSM